MKFSEAPRCCCNVNFCVYQKKTTLKSEKKLIIMLMLLYA